MKTDGNPESYLALRLGSLVERFVEERDLGWVYTTAAIIRVTPDQIREPDVSYTSWDKRPERTVPLLPITSIIPDLTAEIISPSNTVAEITRKISEYFRGGVRLVWVIDPLTRSAEVYTATDAKTLLAECGTLGAGDVLPGFTPPLAKLFERLERPTVKPARTPKKKP